MRTMAKQTDFKEHFEQKIPFKSKDLKGIVN
ncbi:hypothetical protein SAMN04488121_107210 [Chitinophaga filiformis]|uniref:Uncharacterized protein n=1 Tax=Chitinophaga filiformis TaxID=104663 RepID=A0A1G7Y5G7_CHIFI|nr:hypothetical protein SAMN04488121_107210 [Chitinophaga filiformis]